MTTLESYYIHRLKLLLNIDLKETATKHVFAADYLTFNLQKRTVYIDYNEEFTLNFLDSVVYLNGYNRDNYASYIAKYPEIQAHDTRAQLTIHPKNALYNDSSIIDEDKVSKLEWSKYSDHLDYLLVWDINNILATNFSQLKSIVGEDNVIRCRVDTELKDHIFKDEKTQFVINTEQMFITIDNMQHTFKLDEHYMYIYSASQHYKKFLQYSNIVVHKPVCSTLVLSKVYN